MKNKLIIIFGFPLASLYMASAAAALTMTDFITICESTDKTCDEHRILQAYVGGSLDLIAALDEETEYLDKVYCKEPKNLFDVSRIIKFMESHQVEYAQKNAMLLVIRYLEENGGCKNL